MSLFKNVSIRRKLLLIIIGINLLVLIPAFLFFMSYGLRLFQDEAKRELAIVADMIGHNCTAALVFEDAADATETLNAFEADASIVSAYLFNQNGNILARYDRDGSSSLAISPQVRQDGYYFENGGLSCFHSIFFKGSLIGMIAIQTDLSGMYAIMKRTLLVIVLAFLACLLCAVLLSLRMQRVITEPVYKLANLARTVSEERDYSVRGTKESEDELGTLVDAFNDMLKQIQRQNEILMHARQEAVTYAEDAIRLAEKVEENNLILQEEIRAKRRAEEKLQIHQAYLEQMVQDRTAELKYSNEKLAEEIEERKAVEKRLRASLNEKSTLLSEIHHRVRNNLQIISSLLGLTHRRTLNADARQIIEETRSRIFSMAMIHSHLYSSGNFNQIDMESHIYKLWSSIQQIHEPLQKKVIPAIHCSNIYLPLPQAIPCSLVLNEAVTNVFKYAYKKGKGGPCHISMERCRDNRICLRIRDEGRGIPEAVDVDTTETLGLKLMRNLARRQLQGEFRVERNGGTEIWIEFSLLSEDQLVLEKGKDDTISRTHSNQHDDASFEMTGRDIP